MSGKLPQLSEPFIDLVLEDEDVGTVSPQFSPDEESQASSDGEQEDFHQASVSMEVNRDDDVVSLLADDKELGQEGPGGPPQCGEGRPDAQPEEAVELMDTGEAPPLLGEGSQQARSELVAVPPPESVPLTYEEWITLCIEAQEYPSFVKRHS